MSLVENTIPAFSTWKMFNDTIPALFKMENSEINFERLGKILKSDEFSNIFVYKHQPTLTMEEYESVADKYKSFTAWLLGRFFYLLSAEKVARIHDTIVDAQVRILYLLSVTQPHVYHDFSAEYCLALKHLLGYARDSESVNLNLEVFTPQQHTELKGKLDLSPIYIEVTSKTVCLNILKKIMRVFQMIFRRNFSICLVNERMYESLDNFIYIVAECDVGLKLEALDAVFQAVSLLEGKHFPAKFVEIMNNITTHFEQLVYEIVNNKVKTTKKEKMLFEDILKMFNESLFFSEPSRKVRIAEFILTSRTSEFTCSEELLAQCVLQIRNSGVSDNSAHHISSILDQNRVELLCFLERELKTNSTLRQQTWHQTVATMREKWQSTICTSYCKLTTQLVMFSEIANIALRLQLVTDLQDFLNDFLMNCANHFGRCKTDVSQNMFLKTTALCSLFCTATDLPKICKLISHPLDPSQLGQEFQTREMKVCCSFLSSLQKPIVFRNLTEFFDVLLFLTTHKETNKVRNEALCLLQKLVRNTETASSAHIVHILTRCVILFGDSKDLVSDVFMSLLQSQNTEVLKEATMVLPDVVCMISSSYFVGVVWDEQQKCLKTSLYCTDCKKHENLSNRISKLGPFNTPAPNRLKYAILKASQRFFNTQDHNIGINVVNALVSFARHIEEFHNTDLTKLWMSFAGVEDDAVRKAFARVVFAVFEAVQKCNQPNEYKDEFLTTVYECLKVHTKRSIQYKKVNLQYSILQTLESLIETKSETALLHNMNLLLYFIILPNSKHSLVAVDNFLTIEKRHKTKTKLLYLKFRKELCKTLADLCAINQALLNRPLQTSLQKVALLLEFFSTKDFVTEEWQYLLPYFVALLVKMPKVQGLIQEMAVMVGMSVSQLLASKYGYIFLYVYLKESEEVCKASLSYLERETGMSSAILRKNNFRVLLSELLLNFHEHRDRVLSALNLLLCDEESRTIQDQLQPLLLGILRCFDRNLERNALLSLAELLKFMGANLSPMRFKIIAMLRTALDLNSSFSELHCDVWEAFVRSCDIDCLGPQLATIFVSLLPLADSFPAHVNSIFRYLIVENELHVRDNIRDLFFVTCADADVQSVIARYVQDLQALSFKEQLNVFLKYLNYETIDVRMHGFKFVKELLERNREELDRMILGYNGIDPTIVELLDLLMSGCREKDEKLKLTCAEVIGVLGAIEPSHLPRRYAQSRSFVFFIDEQGFVVNVLAELIRALQAEVKTLNLDRYSLAIQEILKTYGISSDRNSPGFHIWCQFSEIQQELMRPLLSSKYMNIQPANFNFSVPIYGSTDGASFQCWIYNWTCSLVSAIQSDKKTLLHACLPSMKQGRIVMEFLPHILLHALLEGNNADNGNIYTEMITVINSFNSRHKLDESVTETRPLRKVDMIPNPQPMAPEESKQIACTRVIFILLDFLERWTREWLWQKSPNKQQTDYRKIKSFLQQFSKMQLARCNYQCDEYPRALVYLEEYIEEHRDQMVLSLSFLAELYARLDEPDGVAGVMAVQQSEPTIEQRILALEVTGKLADAAACYERAAHPPRLEHLKGLVRCYLDLDNVNTALNVMQGASEKQPEWESELMELQAEALWRLGRYEDLEEVFGRPDFEGNGSLHGSWGVQIGKALSFFKKDDTLAFRHVIEQLRVRQVEALGAATLEEGAYQHGYGYITRLHVLNEMEHLERTVRELERSTTESALEQLASEWELRIKVVQESVKVTEPILCMRRVMLNEAKEKFGERLPLIDSLLGELWLMSAKTARSATLHQQAYTYTLKAEEFAPPKLFLEKAKLHWLREEQEQALTVLKHGLEKIGVDSLSGGSANSQLSVEQRKICAEAKLLIASYNDAVSNVDTDTNIQHYKSAVEIFREWEKSLVHLAQYYDRVFSSFSDEDRDAKGSDMQIHMINYFGKSLQYGSNYVYQSMPRLLSIWFDYGTRLLDVKNNSIREERKSNLLKMTKLVDSFLERLPSYIFLTAFSQLVSRICHPQREVYVELKAIIVKLLLQYPQQTLWMMMPMAKSSYAVRAKRCSEIFNDTRLQSPTMTALVRDFTNLAEKLMELCNKEVPDGAKATTVGVLLRTLPRMLSKSDFSEIMIPIHKFRKLVLPNPDFKSSQHNPFPNHYVHIVGIEDEVAILTSLQKPRKITLRGSDGKRYVQMLKAKDDLRKDFRLMEFNDIVNQLLSREADARQRRLNIRLYSVAPLNEECGMIEWVPDLLGLRPILTTLYKQKGIQMTGRELKELCCNLKDPLVKKREIFLKKLLPRHPPVLGEWFRRTFPDAQTWLTARTAYIRTTAVVSMVGYILGLGDRHGENIQLDSICGDTVHVDFNCLFNKGETFEWPERVPFRLTQNMVAAMGPLGVEGMFRRACVVTLRVLRSNTNTLMSIVTPFVYDPLVSWPRNAPASLSAQNTERTNEQAVEHIKNIELRLQGIVKVRSRSFSIPLSVEGQANNLIKEAMSIDNLCQMYIGWGPYL